uniref:Tumor necrosis factor receptor superfamily, member a n=1 Tax=Gadus morhua TaxID=8049 RepID=A0A8C5A3M0_GADMO
MQSPCVCVCVCVAAGRAAGLGPAAQWSGDDYANRTLRRLKTCVENQQYQHQGLCCLNCDAGTYVHQACSRELEVGLCKPCHGMTYTEHSNGMNRCLPCTHCRSDEMATVSCTSTTDTKCQCKPGSFCVPDQACEVCKRCARYETACVEPASPSLPSSGREWRHGGGAAERPERRPGGRRGPPARVPPAAAGDPGGHEQGLPPGEDEDRGLGDSLPNTTSSSQTSLSALPTVTASPSSSNSSSRSSPHPSPTPTQTLLPTAMKSLRKSFDLFDEYLDVRIHNKFFRLIGVSDNHIRLAEGAPPGDKVYDLLKSWMQREGLKADINNLLDALLSMDQRRSADEHRLRQARRFIYRYINENTGLQKWC